MKVNTLLVNILSLAFIGAAFVTALAHAVGVPFSGGDTGPQLAVLALGGTFVGGVVTTMVRLASPDPDPSVPASVVGQILAAFGVSPPADLDVSAEPGPVAGKAVLILALIGAVLVGGMVFVLDSEAAIVTVAGGFVGGLVSLASDLVKPPPNPSVPASVVLRLIDGTPKHRPPGATA